MIRSIPQLESLRDEWNALASARRSPLLEHDWFLSCAEAFHGDGDLRIVTARDHGRLVGVAPLVQDAERPGRRLTLLGATRLHEPCDWLHDTPDAAADLADRALALGSPLVLQRVPEGSATVAALCGGRSRRALTVVRDTATALGVCTEGDWRTYLRSLSSQVTSNLRRVRRKAEAALGPMTVERVHPAPAEVDALLEAFMAIEGSGWKGRRGSNLGSRADLRQFFRLYAHRAASQGRLQVAWLKFGSQLAAGELSVAAHGRMWQLKIGYHEAVSTYYPGLHLTAASIQEAFERGLEAYEFLGSAAAWEERWNPEVRRFRTLVAYPMTTAGLAGAGRDLVGSLLRRIQGQASPL